MWEPGWLATGDFSYTHCFTDLKKGFAAIALKLHR